MAQKAQITLRDLTFEEDGHQLECLIFLPSTRCCLDSWKTDTECLLPGRADSLLLPATASAAALPHIKAVSCLERVVLLG